MFPDPQSPLGVLAGRGSGPPCRPGEPLARWRAAPPRLKTAVATLSRSREEERADLFFAFPPASDVWLRVKR